MDQVRIEEGLKRLQRAAEKEKIEQKLKEAEEATKHVEPDDKPDDGILTEEEEKRQNEILRTQHPDDICPVCQTHVVDGRYLVMQNIGAIVCGVCQNIFMPKSRYDDAVKSLERRRRSKEQIVETPDKEIIVPKVSI